MLDSILNVLDLPGSSVRDVFAGKNPFDQWASPLSGDHRTSGADLVSQYTRFNPQSMGAKVVGMGVEMLLDPTNLLGGAGILKRLIGARRLAQTNKAFDATELANLVDTGRYGLVNPEAVARSLERRATTDVVEAMPSPLRAGVVEDPAQRAFSIRQQLNEKDMARSYDDQYDTLLSELESVDPTQRDSMARFYSSPLEGMNREQWLEKVVQKNASLRSILSGIDMSQPDNQMIFRNMASAFEGGDPFKEGSPLMSMLQGFTSDIGDVESLVVDPLYDAIGAFPEFKNAMKQIATNVGEEVNDRFDMFVPELLHEGPVARQAEVFRQMREVLPGIIERNAGNTEVGSLRQMLNVATLYDDPFEAAAKEFERVKGVWDTGTARAMPSPLQAGPAAREYLFSAEELEKARLNAQNKLSEWFSVEEAKGWDSSEARAARQAYEEAVRKADVFDVPGVTSPLTGQQTNLLPFYDDKVTLHHASPNLWAPEPGYPHGRARLDFMGEGEGNQMFGRGLYFAENPDVVDGRYMNTLGKEVATEGTDVAWLSAHEDAVDGLRKLYKEGSESTKTRLRLSLDAYLPDQRNVYDQDPDRFNLVDSILGDKYLIPDDEQALEYSSALLADVLDGFGYSMKYPSGVSKAEQAANEALAYDLGSRLKAARLNHLQGIKTVPPNRYTLSMPKSAREELLKWEEAIADSDLVQKNLPVDIHEQMGETADGYNRYDSNWDYENTGFMVKRLLPDTIADGGISDIHFTPAQLAENSDDVEKMTSQLLNNYGISGARYEDGLSRKGRAKDVTYNNVIWNQDILNQIKPRIINGVNVPLDDMLPLQRIESWTPRAAIPEREYFENTHVSPLRQVATPGAAMGVYNGARIISHE
jgi:hypothetical protein